MDGEIIEVPARGRRDSRGESFRRRGRRYSAPGKGHRAGSKMIEVEVKARAPEDMAERIAALGATLLAVENHHDLYFNSPQRDFKESDEALRIRIKEEGARLTYKGPKLDQTTKSRLERTVKIDDPQQMEQILSALGFVLSAQVRKRESQVFL